MKMKLIIFPLVVLFTAQIMLSGCTEEYSPLSPVEHDPVEFSRQITMAFIELNNYAKALKMYRMDYGEEPENIDKLVDCLDLDIALSPERSELYTLWRFNFTKFQDTVITFEAYSLTPFINGTGNTINYDCRTGEFKGYGKNHVDPYIYVLLFEEPIKPNRHFSLSEESITPDRWQQLNIIRQVNWAANQFRYLERAVRWYRQDFGEYPPSIASLITMEYLDLDKPVQIWWDFGLDFEYDREPGNPYIASVYAVSTENMAGVCGDTLFFDFWTRYYRGRWAEWISPFIGP